MQSCEDNDLILTGQPSWLGNSIYERLQDEGNYKYTLRLIDDLGETEVLSHTGSRTLFVAADSAYDAWFKDNKWNVHSYEELTLPQKRLLLKNSMIDNAYLLELMSNKKSLGDAGTPEWGRTMRRTTSASVYDSVFVMTPEDMPQTIFWDSLRNAGKNIRILKDATVAPMIHFLPAYLQYHKITAEDLNILTNKRATSLNEAWVNGVKVVNSGDPDKKKVDYDVTCKNGYIQKVENVIESSRNMAEIINNENDTKEWSRMLNRFSLPYFYKSLSQSYNQTFKTEEPLYVLLYASKSFNDWSAGGKVTISRDAYAAGGTGRKFTDTYDNVVAFEELLRFDPGWNQYIDDNQENDLHNDAGMMIVPTDEAVLDWWNTTGKELQDEYHYLDSVPMSIIAELINVNMISTFSSFVPSKFASVLNDAKEPLGIKKEDVVGCYMGCNGVVYKVDKVFTPALFSSVAYPALAHASTMNIIYSIIDGRNFKPYLLSMDSKYALLLPSNEAMMTILDPGSYGGEVSVGEGKQEAPDIIELTYDKTKKEIKAVRYTSTVDENGNITKGDQKASSVNGNVLNKLYDSMMDQMIVVIPDKTKTLEQYVNAGYKFFKTKGGSLLKVTSEGGKLAFQGGWQIEHNVKIPAENSYVKDNGKSYEIAKMPPMGAQKSVYLTLKEHSEFSEFLTFLENDYVDNLLKNKLSNKYNAGMLKQSNKNLSLLDNYNYTIYVPSNEAIRQFQNDKLLPTEAELDREGYNAKTGADPKLDSICLAEGWYGPDVKTATDSLNVRTKVATTLNTIISDFVRYHVQDHSVAIGMAPDVDDDGKEKTDTKYESMKRDLETGRFYPLNVNFTKTAMTVKDVFGTTHKVNTGNINLYNQICREYWFEGTGDNSRLFMASDAVVHQIDGVLCTGYTYPANYEKDPSKAGKTVKMRPWREIVEEALNK